MKIRKLFFVLSLLILSLFTAQAQISVVPTPAKYAVDSGVPFDDQTFVSAANTTEMAVVNGRYWQRIFFCEPINSIRSIDCHSITQTADHYIAIINFVEMRGGVQIKTSKEYIFTTEQVKYTCALR